MGGLRPQLARRMRSLPVLRRYPATYVRSGWHARRMGGEFDAVRAFVLFVGQPRTGHSLVGALLDAHPDAVIAHELDVLKYVAAGYDRDRLFALIVRRETERAAGGGVRSGGYSYGVPGQWQGRYRRLEVIGDKKGGRSTLRLGDDIGLLDGLYATVGTDVRVIRVVRSPYDVIATMQRRAPRRPFGEVVERFFAMEDTVGAVRARLAPGSFHELHLADLIADPAAALTGLCGFLGLPAPPDYVEACQRVLFAAPTRTRDGAPWTPELLARVTEQVAANPSLARYRDHDVAVGQA